MVPAPHLAQLDRAGIGAHRRRAVLLRRGGGARGRHAPAVGARVLGRGDAAAGSQPAPQRVHPAPRALARGGQVGGASAVGEGAPRTRLGRADDLDRRHGHRDGGGDERLGRAQGW